MHIIAEPATIVEKPGPMTVTTGDSCTLECTVAGTPELSARWFKDGHELSSDHKYKTTFFNKVAGLRILNTGLEDSGDYSFEVKNNVGQSSCTASVHVSGSLVKLGVIHSVLPSLSLFIQSILSHLECL